MGTALKTRRGPLSTNCRKEDGRYQSANVARTHARREHTTEALTYRGQGKFLLGLVVIQPADALDHGTLAVLVHQGFLCTQSECQ